MLLPLIQKKQKMKIMKMNLVNLTQAVSVRKMMLLVLLSVSTLISANANSTLPVIIDTKIDVTPKGLVQDEMVFNVNFDNVDGHKLDIKIFDEDGTRLYKEVFSGKKLNKTFKVNSEFGKVVLFVTNTDDGSEQKFVIVNKEGEKVMITSVY
jgi:hypothetical protein